MTELGRQIAVIRGSSRAYNELVAAFHSIIDRHQVVLGHHKTGPRTFDETMGFPEGYASKLLAPHYTRVMGPSLGTLLTGLRLKLIVAEDEEATSTILEKLKKRARANTRMPTVRKRKRRRFLPFLVSPEFAREARAIALLRQSPEQRKRNARKAAKARWRKKPTALA